MLLLELLKYIGRDDIFETFDNWVPPRFPVTGYHLMEAKVPKGLIFNKTLNSLKEIWKESNYTLGKDELMEMVQEIVENPFLIIQILHIIEIMMKYKLNSFILS